LIEIPLEKGTELQLVEPLYGLSGLWVHLCWQFALFFSLCFDLVELILTFDFTV
jgi:hypothetical protein